MKDKKIIYGLLSAGFFTILMIIIPWTLFNLSNGGFLFWFLSLPLWITGIMLFIKSWHETKRDVYALAFAFGDLVCILDEGMSYVPFGFLKNAVQEYTAADLNFSETINVIKLEKVEEENSNENDDFFLEGLSAEEKSKVKYKMHTKFEGPLRINGKKGAVRFFEKTGLKEFLPKSKIIKKGEHAFYNNTISDLASDFDTISSNWGYARFRTKTDWTLEDIIKESGKIAGSGGSSLKDNLDEYGLTIGKVATYTKFDSEIEEILTGSAKAKAERPIKEYKAETERRVRIKQGEAEAEVEATKIERTTQATTKAYNDSVESMRKTHNNNLSEEALAQKASQAANLVDNEHRYLFEGPGGSELSGLLVNAKGTKNKQMLESLIANFGLTEQLEEFIEVLSGLTEEQQKDVLTHALKTK